MERAAKFHFGSIRAERDGIGAEPSGRRGHSLKAPFFGPFKPPRENGHKILGPLQRISAQMNRFPENEAVDYCVIGVGSAGGVLLQRLAKAGFKWSGWKPGHSGIRSAIG